MQHTNNQHITNIKQSIIINKLPIMSIFYIFLQK